MAISPVTPLFTAHATAKGGRNGFTGADDNSFSVALSVPKEMGGPGRPGTSTPEHLFAAGYAACFGSALDFAAKQQKVDATGAVVTCATSIGPCEAGGYGLAVKLRVVDKTIPQAKLEQLVEETHTKICPYSHATRDNVDVKIEVEGA